MTILSPMHPFTFCRMQSGAAVFGSKLAAATDFGDFLGFRKVNALPHRRFVRQPLGATIQFRRDGEKHSEALPRAEIAAPAAATEASAPAAKIVRHANLRGGLIEDVLDDLGQPKVASGMTTWSSLMDGTVIRHVVAQLSLTKPERGISLTFRRSEGATGDLAIDLVVTGFPAANISLPRMRRVGERGGEPLDMVVREQGNGTFLLMPSSSDEAKRNIRRQVLADEWIDVPIRLGDRTLVLTLEKGKFGQDMLTAFFKD